VAKVGHFVKINALSQILINLSLKNENNAYSALTLSSDCRQYLSKFYSYFKVMADYGIPGPLLGH
jgi:hypothetical protein